MSIVVGLQVLRNFPVVSVKDVLQTAKKVLAIQKNISKGVGIFTAFMLAFRLF